jgi:hypothetical protein
MVTIVNITPRGGIILIRSVLIPKKRTGGLALKADLFWRSVVDEAGLVFSVVAGALS